MFISDDITVAVVFFYYSKTTFISAEIVAMQYIFITENNPC